MPPTPGTLNRCWPGWHGAQLGACFPLAPFLSVHVFGFDGSGIGLAGMYGWPPQFITSEPHVNVTTSLVRLGICVHPNVVGLLP